MNKQLPFWLFTAAVLVALILPTLLQDGMFMDGLLYACVSKNLADGIGSFWFPHYSITAHPFFDQQPPLGFGIQAMFFTLLGDSIYVERFYSFLTAIINAGLIAVLWRTVFKNEQGLKALSWLPVFFWITIPVCFWAYSNNVLENTMSAFDLLAVICIVRFFQKQSYLLILLSGVFIVLASLTKGIQGMFPLVALFTGWVVNSPFREGGAPMRIGAGDVTFGNFSFLKTTLFSLLLLFVPVAIYFLLLQNDTAFQSISAYLNNRVLNSIENIKAADSRFYLLIRLFSELIPMMVAGALLYAFNRKKVSASLFSRQVAFFLLIGVSASFPLMVTLEQRGFYLVTSLPYFAMAGACFSAPYVSTLIAKINFSGTGFKLFRVTSLLLLTGAMVFSFLQIGKISRDRDTLHDIHLIGKQVPHGEVVGATVDLWGQWSFGEYLIRHYYICVDSRIKTTNDYVILEPGTQVADSIKIEKVNIPTIRYHLYKAKR